MPEHAVLRRTALTEVPLWAAWQAVKAARCVGLTVRDIAHLGPDIVADAAPLMARLAIGACLCDIALTLADHLA